MLEYTATTENEADKVTATIPYPAESEVEILLGETEITNGSNATWSEGENILTITVSATGQEDNTYTVTVTQDTTPGT